MKIKYLRFEKNEAILFPVHQEHKEIFRHFTDKNIQSAGTIKIKNGKIIDICGSYSLKLEPDPDDENLLAILMQL